MGNTHFSIFLFEQGMLPAFLIRPFLRWEIASNLRVLRRISVEKAATYMSSLIRKFRKSRIAIQTESANQQHYSLPPVFFQEILGKRMKYSCCYWPESVQNLDQAEDEMLRLTCLRAQIEDGMSILELGCGWGSFCLWIAEHFPRCKVLAVSNSVSQCRYIEGVCRQKGYSGVTTLNADITEFSTELRFDRVVSIEMFEHMKNYEQLMKKVASFLKPHGMLLVHIFSHREYTYEYNVRGPRDWMAIHFFTGGNMPSADLLLFYQQHLRLIRHWRINGKHYARTLRCWFRNLVKNRAIVRSICANVYGSNNGKLWYRRWKLFFLFCEENFKYKRGREFFVSHYLFEKAN
jgi:cyclopropane-fatty-acyl-phospholipid synthase